MFKYTKHLADHWEQYLLTPEETKELVLNAEPEVALQRFYENSARVVCRRISLYKGLDRDELCSYGYIGVRRCYEHLKRNPHKLDKYPYFHKNSYLWVSGALNESVKKQAKHNVAVSVDFEYLDTETQASTGEIEQLAEDTLSKIDYRTFQNSILHKIGLKVAAAEARETVKKYKERIERVRIKMQEAIHEEY